MLFYDLRCPKCEKEYNISAAIAEKTEKRIPCPDCGSLELVTVFKGISKVGRVTRARISIFAERGALMGDAVDFVGIAASAVRRATDGWTAQPLRCSQRQRHPDRRFDRA